MFQQLHVIFIGSLSLYRTQHEGVLRVLQCTVYNTNVDTTCMGELTGHIAAGRPTLAG